MQVPRDLSKRMLEAVDGVSAVDVYERLVPEKKRVNQRSDLLAWLMAYAGTEIQALGLAPSELALLGNVEAKPDSRWALLASHWPSLRTTGTGRMVLRIAWELFGAEDIDERTWKDISASLWQETLPGFYQELLGERGNVRAVLVDNEVDPKTRGCCVPIKSCDRLVATSCRSELESQMQELGISTSLTPTSMDVLIETFVQQHVEQGCVGFKLLGLPAAPVPSKEEATWAFGRLLRLQEPPLRAAPQLQSYILHRILPYIGESGTSLQVHVGGEAEVWRLKALAEQYPQVRFVAMCARGGDAIPLCVLGRTLSNVFLGLVGLWRVSSYMAREALRIWLHSVPSSKIFALGGDMTMVEAVTIQALIAREQIALLLAEMVASGELDEQDALLVMERVLYKNAQSCYLRER
jgi:hypothetical protein